MRKSIIRWAALSMAVAIVVGVSSSRANVEKLVGKPASEISLKTADGKDVSLAALKGKVVLIDFWATWCGPCKASLPNINKIANDKALADKGLVVWAVNLDETPEQVNAFLKQNNYKLTVPIDVGGKVAETYTIEGIPSTMVIGTDGTIKFAVEGFSGEDTEKAISEAIAKALAAK